MTITLFIFLAQFFVEPKFFRRDEKFVEDFGPDEKFLASTKNFGLDENFSLNFRRDENFIFNFRLDENFIFNFRRDENFILDFRCDENFCFNFHRDENFINCA